MGYNPVTAPKVSLPSSCIYEPVFSQILCQSLQLAVQLEFEKSWSFVRSVWNPFSAVLHSKLEYLKKVQTSDWLYDNDRLGKIKGYRKELPRYNIMFLLFWALEPPLLFFNSKTTMLFPSRWLTTTNSIRDHQDFPGDLQVLLFGMSCPGASVVCGRGKGREWGSYNCTELPINKPLR